MAVLAELTLSCVTFHNLIPQDCCNLQVSHGAIQFMVYEELKKVASGPLIRDDARKHSLTALEASVIGAVSKLAASIVTYPSQVLS